jgi:MazG family protein
VFGDVTVADSAEVESNWEAIKAAEKPSRTGIFDGVVAAAPALAWASKVQQRAARVGFDWPDVEGPIAKVSEEIAEVAVARLDPDPDVTAMEVGDLLFAVVNVARHLDVDPESALRRATHKFTSRVESVEALARASGREMSSMRASELDGLWDMVKSRPTH